MTLAEIKAAVEAGEVVRWMNSWYKVVKDRLGQWLIICTAFQIPDAIGLTHQDGVTLNGREEEFYIEH